jgi:hypothetical protein
VAVRVQLVPPEMGTPSLVQVQVQAQVAEQVLPVAVST